MAIHREATCKIYYPGEYATESYGCEVRLGQDGSIAVSYEAENGPCLYLGAVHGDGHYLLTCEEVRGRASLHRFGDGLILEGYWEESGEQGMWRIELGEVSDLVSGIDDDDDELSDGWGDDDEPDCTALSDMRTHSVPLADGTEVRFRLPSSIGTDDLLRLSHCLSGLVEHHGK